MNSTIKEVAKEAGVAPSTVSRVIHNSSKISQATKDNVTKAMKKLNYSPNIVARSLVKNSTKIIGIILPNDPDELFNNPFFIEAMRGLSIYAQDIGYNLMYAFSKNEETEVQFIENYMQSRLVDGVVLFTSRRNDKCVSTLKDNKFPFVVLGKPVDTEGTYWVDNDNFQAMYNVVQHMISKGKQKIGFIGGPSDYNFSRNRLDGYKTALSNRDISINEELITEASSFTENAGYNCMKRIFDSQNIDTVVTVDDLLAFGAQKFIKERNLKDISVIGFNNTARSSYQSPSLTTVDVNPERLGEMAGKLLINIIENGEVKINHHIVETKLIERESTLT